MTPTIQLELNEINFDYVRRYAGQGQLPNLARLMDRYGVAETESEERYEWLEPWVQWVTAHTGLSYAEHKVFRLGDIVSRPDIEQVWERLEGKGRSVAAVSPMNARNDASASPFFVPDPWTDTAVTGGPLLEEVYAAIRKAVNDNAQGRLSLGDAWALAKGVLGCTRPGELAELSRIAASARGAGWRKAIFLDVFLSAVFLRLWEKHQPDFATLFLNAGAHIQHHYMFSSAAYDGPHRNPDWYLADGLDPLLEIYSAYDRIVARVQRRCPQARLILATGLHQDPEPEPIYYWRPRSHAGLMERLGVPHRAVHPRMSRDFLVECESDGQAGDAVARLDAMRIGERAVFTTDLRGHDIFVELSYPDALPAGSVVEGAGGGEPVDLAREVAFVALKNGRHNGIGYVIDTAHPELADRRLPLTDLAFAVD